MRTPESTIQERLLFPVEEIRTTALAYFARAHRQEETLMPLVIQAIEQYGRDTAVRFLQEADELPQTEATIRWLTDELAKDWYLEDVSIDNYCTAVALVLCKARVDLLRPEMADLPAFPEELKGMFLERLEMAAWDWPTGWAALEQLARECRAQGGFRWRDVRRGERVIESLARHLDKATLLLPLLERQYQGQDSDLMDWLEPLLVELAGRMRLTEAVPLLVEWLHEDDYVFTDSCVTALVWIGSDEVVRAIAEQWPEADPNFRQSAALVLEDLHTDLSAAKCLEFLAAEDEDDTREFLAHALLGNFVEASVEPIRQMILTDELLLDPADMKQRLIAACTVMGTSFPEYQEWYEQAVAEDWGWGGYEPERIRRQFRHKEGEFDEAGFDDEGELDDEGWAETLDDVDLDEEEFEAEPFGGSPRHEEPYRPEPIRREQPRVGRNDPCPCGSGKKYKKCCLGKDQEGL